MIKLRSYTTALCVFQRATCTYSSEQASIFARGNVTLPPHSRYSPRRRTKVWFLAVFLWKSIFKTLLLYLASFYMIKQFLRSLRCTTVDDCLDRWDLDEYFTRETYEAGNFLNPENGIPLKMENLARRNYDDISTHFAAVYSTDFKILSSFHRFTSVHLSLSFERIWSVTKVLLARRIEESQNSEWI